MAESDRMQSKKERRKKEKRKRYRQTQINQICKCDVVARKSGKFLFFFLLVSSVVVSVKGYLAYSPQHAIGVENRQVFELLHSKFEGDSV